MPWQVKYFEERERTIPAKRFENTLPKKLRAKLLRITKEVAASDGAIGGGYFEPCHNYPGLYEVRVRFGQDLARFLCARDGNTLVLLGGVFKQMGEETPEDCFVEATTALTEYRETLRAV
jgi:hypothetical protein